MVTEEIIDMLGKDNLALNDKQLQIDVKQAAPYNMKKALVRAAEFEFLLTDTATLSYPTPHYGRER